MSAAAEFETSFPEDCKLLHDVCWAIVLIGEGKDICIVKEDHLDTMDDSFMDSKDGTSSDRYMDVVSIVDPCWISRRVASFPWAISVLVWANDTHILA